MRKIPTQDRAKQRVERMLDATETLIIEAGVANLTVNDIAARAEVPIGSLYQYFTNRDEVLRALCDRHYRILQLAAADCFVNVTTVHEFMHDVRKALKLCWDYTQENPGYRRLFFDVQAWEVMREADWEDTFANAKRMSKALQRLAPNAPYDSLLAFCVIVGDSASGTARLASRFGRLKSELFEQFLQTVESQVYAILRNSSSLERRNIETAEFAPARTGSVGTGPSRRARRPPSRRQAAEG
jgi:AcrR family transcriptional regulator